MRELQAQIISELGVKPQIDPATEVERRVGFLCDYFRATRARGFVLGISGGVDSTLAGKLAQLAVTRLRADGEDAQFMAMRLPHGVQHDEDDAQAALAFIAPDRTITFDVVERFWRCGRRVVYKVLRSVCRPGCAFGSELLCPDAQRQGRVDGALAVPG